MLRSLSVLIGWLALCFGAAFVGSMLTQPALPGWYASLNKPGWKPPDWVFGPVWTLLYFMMALAAWRIQQTVGLAQCKTAIALFVMQLSLNVLWSGLFFGLRMPGAAFAEILLLWAAIAFTTIAFWRIHRSAGRLMVPYFLWVGYAAALNYAIWKMN